MTVRDTVDITKKIQSEMKKQIFITGSEGANNTKGFDFESGGFGGF